MSDKTVNAVLHWTAPSAEDFKMDFGVREAQWKTA